MLVCQVLLIEACMPKIDEIFSKFNRMKKPCTDSRRRTIRVGRNPGRIVAVYDFGAHDGKSLSILS
ncbi:hypothetical protein LOAG_06020 [Loa loa]|uniref:Uncharacterized protein n=1 Tax=Loa loa TaxID=7209 RepID=A0A1S0TZA1_LOALO|nr:hypothetical protein LOAG_06020 [Loa loa]EFO22465.1 hypothetical protein LOAG_06020 [Loa loa]